MKPRPSAVVLGMDGARREAEPPALEVPPVVSAESPSPDVDVGGPELATPPKDLRAEERKAWEVYAPYAIQQGTLIASTVGGFRQLCKALALSQTLLRAVHRKGPGTRDAESSLRLYVRLDQRVDAMLARFKLTAFGKPADAGFTGQAAPVKPPVNAWARVAGK